MYIISQHKKTRINRDQYTFGVINSWEHLKNLKKGPVHYLGLEGIIHIVKSQIHLARQSL